MFKFLSKMIKVCSQVRTVPGIDVSHYDQTIDWKRVELSGIKFAFIKCTEGAFYNDRMYAKNKTNARAAGIIVGAYHFFHPKHDAMNQAIQFLNKCGDLTGCLPPVLDWETTDDIPSKEDRSKALLWLSRVESETGKTPIIYCSPYFAQALSLGSEFARYPLWIAHYGTDCPLVPPPWKNWTFWQYSDKGAVPGIPAPDEDMDVFNGTLDQLKALAGIK